MRAAEKHAKMKAALAEQQAKEAAEAERRAQQQQHKQAHRERIDVWKNKNKVCVGGEGAYHLEGGECGWGEWVRGDRVFWGAAVREEDSFLTQQGVVPCVVLCCAGQRARPAGQPADCIVGGQWLAAHQHGRPAGAFTGGRGAVLHTAAVRSSWGLGGICLQVGGRCSTAQPRALGALVAASARRLTGLCMSACRASP